MDALIFRKATERDMAWIYGMFRVTMKDYIEQTWGWDELFQKHGFTENLPAASFSITALNDVDVGVYNLVPKRDHLWLEMLLVLPEYQNRGLGARILHSIQAGASLKKKPLRLSVLKVNPACDFYRRFGFEIRSEDAFSYKLEWSPPADS